MLQAERAYTPGPSGCAAAVGVIAGRYVQRQGYAQARDACPIESDESVFDAICSRLTALDRDIIAAEPCDLSELAMQARVVIDADSDFLTENARAVLKRLARLVR